MVFLKFLKISRAQVRSRSRFGLAGPGSPGAACLSRGQRNRTVTRAGCPPRPGPQGGRPAPHPSGSARAGGRGGSDWRRRPHRSSAQRPGGGFGSGREIVIPPFCCSRSRNSEVRLGWASRAPSAAPGRPSAGGWRASWLLCASQGGEGGQGWRAVFSVGVFGLFTPPMLFCLIWALFFSGALQVCSNYFNVAEMRIGGPLSSAQAGAPPQSVEALSLFLSCPPSCGPGGTWAAGRVVSTSRTPLRS